MTYRGHVKNGQILLDEPTRLPEGATVNVQLVKAGDLKEGKPIASRGGGKQPFEPINMPGGPLSDDIVRDRR